MSLFSGVLRGVGKLGGGGLGGFLLAAGFTVLYGGPAPAGSWPATDFQTKEQPVPVLGIKVLKTFPHDPPAFTQGLESYGAILYESTGEPRQSLVRKIELE